MSKFFKVLYGQPRSIQFLGGILFFILTIGFCLAFATNVAESIKQEYFERPICLKNECVDQYFKETSQSFSIAKATLDFGVAIATIGGIFVALLSYFTTSSNTALTNHIEHLKIFGEYLESETSKRDRISNQNIDVLLLYGTIFSQSRIGKTTVSKEYKDFINDLNFVIEESNQRCVVGTPGGFSYSDHQRKIKDHLSRAGISIYMSPRNDYMEMEDQLFSLINRISQSFCPPKTVPGLIKRSYY